MYQFIENIKDKIKRIELIIEQNKLTFEEYFNKKTGSYKEFYQNDRYKQKACLKIITPQQSIFALVGKSHNSTANSILDAIFDGDFQRENDSIALTDIKNNIELGNIYIRICDTDVKSGKQTFISKLLSDVWCNVSIYVPETFNQYQINELRKSIEEIKEFNGYFKTQNFFLRHYNNENSTLKKDYEDDEIYDFLDKDKGVANNYIRRIIPNSKEIIIAEIFKNNLRNVSTSSIRRSNSKNGDNIIPKDQEINK